MTRLEQVSEDELENELVEIDGYREVRRLLAALMYKRGPSVPMLAEWFTVREATIYRWFDRLESEPIEDAIQDEERSGRPPKLSASNRQRFETALKRSPREEGYDAARWSPELARRYLQAEFGVTYTERHVRRLLTALDD